MAADKGTVVCGGAITLLMLVPLKPFKYGRGRCLPWRRDDEDERSRVGAVIVRPTATGQPSGTSTNLHGPLKIQQKLTKPTVFGLSLGLSLVSSRRVLEQEEGER